MNKLKDTQLHTESEVPRPPQHYITPTSLNIKASVYADYTLLLLKELTI
jgi:hypothetical protein